VFFKEKKNKISDNPRLEETTDFIFIKENLSVDFESDEYKTQNRKYGTISQVPQNDITNVLDTLPDLVLRIHNKGNITYCNNNSKILNLSRQEMLGRNISEIFHPLTHIQFIEALDNIKRTGLSQVFSFQQFEMSELHEYETRIDITKDNDDFIAIIRDTSEQRLLELQLKKNEEKFRRMLESLSHSVVLADKRKRIRYINNACEKLFGYKKEELLDQCIEKLIPKKLQSRFDSYFDDLCNNPDNHEIIREMDFTGCHKKGNTFPMETSFSLIEISDGTFIMISMNIRSK